MSYQTLLDKFKELPEESYDELSDYVDFLIFKFNLNKEKGGSKRKIGGFNGSLKYMADDFDAPLDDFKEYM